MPLCLAAAASPIRRRWLALVELLAPSVARAGAGGAYSARCARRLPDRAKIDAGGTGGASGGSVRARHWRWCARWAKPSLVLVAVVLAYRHSPPAPTSTTGTDRYRRFPSPMLQIYVSSLLNVSEVCITCCIRCKCFRDILLKFVQNVSSPNVCWKRFDLHVAYV